MLKAVNFKQYASQRRLCGGHVWSSKFSKKVTDGTMGIPHTLRYESSRQSLAAVTVGLATGLYHDPCISAYCTEPPKSHAPTRKFAKLAKIAKLRGKISR